MSDFEADTRRLQDQERARRAKELADEQRASDRERAARETDGTDVHSALGGSAQPVLEFLAYLKHKGLPGATVLTTRREVRERVRVRRGLFGSADEWVVKTPVATTRGYSIGIMAASMDLSTGKRPPRAYAVEVTPRQLYEELITGSGPWQQLHWDERSWPPLVYVCEDERLRVRRYDGDVAMGCNCLPDGAGSGSIVDDLFRVTVVPGGTVLVRYPRSSHASPESSDGQDNWYFVGLDFAKLLPILATSHAPD